MNNQPDPGSAAGPSAPAAAPAPRSAPPSNGLKGLRHWRQDLLAGFVVSLVSLPLSSGIAIASGAPPIYGIISAIIAGLIFPLVGGSYVTISGPAAGLAPALMATMIALGGAGDADVVGAGYHMLLAVIFLAGLLQIVMAKLNLARFASIFPASAVEGMLGAIGALILVKALPLAFGYNDPVHAHGFLEYVAEIPAWWRGGHGGVKIIAGITLALMLAANSRYAQRWSLLRKIPPHLFGVAFAIPAAALIGLGADDPRFLIAVPSDPLSGLSLPDFSGLVGRSDLRWAALVGVVTLMLIDGVESLATAQAIDRIDPYQRRSDPDRVLFAMGLSNMASSLIGGLTVIPGGVKSKTCIEAGGRTLWTNFANALFLLAFLFLAPGLLGLLPKAALGAILIYTGWKMLHPSIARGLAAVGPEQVIVYTLTIATTLLTDLLIGVFAGTVAKLLIVVWLRHSTLKASALSPAQLIREIFADPVESVEARGELHVLHVRHPVVSFNAYRLLERVRDERRAGHAVAVLIEPASGVIDHTSMEALHRMERDHVEVAGLESLQPRTRHPASVRRVA